MIGTRLTTLLSTIRQHFTRGATLRHIGGLWIAEAVGMGALALQGIIAARILGPHSYGISALIMGYVASIFAFVDAHSSEATIKYIGEFRARNESARIMAVVRFGFAVDILLSFVALSVVGVSASWAQDHIIDARSAVSLLVLFSASLCFRSLANTSAAVLVSSGRFKDLSLIRGGLSIIRAVIVIVAVVSERSVASLILANSVASVAEGIAMFGLTYPSARRAWATEDSGGTWAALAGRRREIIRFLFWTDFGSFFGTLFKHMDAVILGYFRGPTQVGYYRLARSIASLGGTIVGPLQAVAYPRFAQLWGGRMRAELKSTVRKFALWVGLPLGGLALVSTVILPSVIRLLVGNAYDRSIPAAQILIAGTAVWIAFFWLRPAFSALGRVRFWAINGGTFAVISTVGFVFSAKWFGLYGVSTVYAAGILLSHVVAAIYLRTRTELGRQIGIRDTKGPPLASDGGF